MDGSTSSNSNVYKARTNSTAYEISSRQMRILNARKLFFNQFCDEEARVKNGTINGTRIKEICVLINACFFLISRDKCCIANLRDKRRFHIVKFHRLFDRDKLDFIRWKGIHSNIERDVNSSDFWLEKCSRSRHGSECPVRVFPCTKGAWCNLTVL